MDLLRLPWIQNGGNARHQFPLDHLFRREGAAAAGRRVGAAAAAGADNQNREDAKLRTNFTNNHKDFKLTSPLQKVLDELNMSILPHDVRLNAIVQAAEHFDHRDRARHDYELNEGAARIIYQKIAFVSILELSNYSAGSSYNVNASAMSTPTSGHNDRHLSTTPTFVHNGTDPISMQKLRSTRSQEASDSDYEIAMLTTCLEMVHRASPHAIAYVWANIGEESLPILVKILERPFVKIQNVLDRAEKCNHSANATEKALSIATNRETKVSVQKVTKILAMYRLIPEAKIKMAKCPGLLPVLVKITDTHNLNRMKSMRPVSKRLLKKKNDQHFDDDRSLISLSTKLLTPLAPKMDGMNASGGNGGEIATEGANGIRGTSAGVGLYMTEASRFNAIAVLTNLTSVEKNRMLMLSEPGLVNNIARVVHNERSDIARQCSALAIMNLSNGDREHVPELAGNDALLESIIKLTKDDAPETRSNAVIALFNVACADENTVKLARYKDGIVLEVLMRIVDNEEDFADTEMNDDVRTTAAEALFNISCSSIVETTDRFANHPNLLETCALLLKSQYVNKEVKVYCAAILRRIAEIVHYPKQCQLELLSALVKASTWTRTTCIAEAFLSQAVVIDNRSRMVEHHGLLTALSKLALVSGNPESERIRKAAVSAIEHLSREVSIRRVLSSHEGIMLAMTRASYGNSSRGFDGNSSHASSFRGLSDDEISSTSETSKSMQLALKRLVETI